MTTGIDTYATAADADVYIAAHYRSTSPEYARWTALSGGDKTVLLTNAFEEIERLPLRGEKYNIDQPLQFPRIAFGIEIPPPDIPESVRSAQIELALWLSDDPRRREEDRRTALQSQGVTGFTLGDLTENYGGTVTVGALGCPKLRTLLSTWLNGALDSL